MPKGQTLRPLGSTGGSRKRCFRDRGSIVLRVGGSPERGLVQHFARNIFQHASRNVFFMIFVVLGPIWSPLGSLGGHFFVFVLHIFSEVDFGMILESVLGGAGGRGGFV